NLGQAPMRPVYRVERTGEEDGRRGKVGAAVAIRLNAHPGPLAAQERRQGIGRLQLLDFDRFPGQQVRLETPGDSAGPGEGVQDYGVEYGFLAGAVALALLEDERPDRRTMLILHREVKPVIAPLRPVGRETGRATQADDRLSWAQPASPLIGP